MAKFVQQINHIEGTQENKSNVSNFLTVQDLKNPWRRWQIQGLNISPESNMCLQKMYSEFTFSCEPLKDMG
jgi:hypothetical protein